MEEIDDAALDERQAYCRGKKGGTNPYEEGTKFHTMWQWGYAYSRYCITADACEEMKCGINI